MLVYTKKLKLWHQILSSSGRWTSDPEIRCKVGVEAHIGKDHWQKEGKRNLWVRVRIRDRNGDKIVKLYFSL